MQAIHNIDLLSLRDSFISLFSAFLLGALIGLERQYRQRTAGLRTNVLVSVGAAMFVDLANRLHGADGALHVVAYVVSGIGFLGAGVIMREEGNVRGINTAATLWCSAAIGACAGADLILEAALGALFVLCANTLLRPVVDAINRKPLDATAVEMSSVVHVVTSRERGKTVLAMLDTELAQSDYPISDLVMRSFSSDEVEIRATLPSTSVDAALLDRLIDRLLASPDVRQAFWSPSGSE
ncbi:MgtC/SapB family protein [Noviherbaspirillum pedocola]|uniref:Protein MgtC n=1 Tax=Noviherbaspirillum pedocola TaxID=2801341 RepID=A0A934W4D5_9BURK|nr:MgtC/SapB family protein [Noviherbaspirillum pedocola]MBK4733767.1 MgtC/SapB family protein [Noviherbaspirillum pedocola]